jgi:toxin YhaV
MLHHGWTLLFHDCLLEQLTKLKLAAERAEVADPSGFEENANVKLYRVLSL